MISLYICIPNVYRIRGDPVYPMPAEDHPFWDALTRWIEGGQRAGRNESGVWDCIL